MSPPGRFGAASGYDRAAANGGPSCSRPRRDANTAASGAGTRRPEPRAWIGTLAVAIMRAVSRRLLTVAALAAVVTVCLAWAVTLDYLSDDAFITFRYARNLARGEGLVYNPGERVEGYTNFLEVVILAGLHRLGADLVRAGRALGLASAAATVLLTWAI